MLYAKVFEYVKTTSDVAYAFIFAHTYIFEGYRCKCLYIVLYTYTHKPYLAHCWAPQHCWCIIAQLSLVRCMVRVCVFVCATVCNCACACAWMVTCVRGLRICLCQCGVLDLCKLVCVGWCVRVCVCVWCVYVCACAACVYMRRSEFFFHAASMQRYLISTAGHLRARCLAWSSIAGKPRAMLGTAMFACH